MHAILQTELLQISRTNFSESFQILVHLKVLYLFIESVLRYGLPANYVGFITKVRRPNHAIVGFLCLIVPPKPEPKATKRTLTALQTQFAHLGRRSNAPVAKGKPQSSGTDEVAGEYQTLLEQEFFDFVLAEVPWIQL